MPQGVFQSRLKQQGRNLCACRNVGMQSVGERDGPAEACGFQDDTGFQGFQLFLEGMDRRLLDIPVLVPKAFERHECVKRLVPSPFCRQPMHRGQCIEHEMRAEVKVEPLAFRILPALLDVVLLRSQTRLHVQELVPFQPFGHGCRGNGGRLRPPPGPHAPAPSLPQRKKPQPCRPACHGR